MPTFPLGRVARSAGEGGQISWRGWPDQQLQHSEYITIFRGHLNILTYIVIFVEILTEKITGGQWLGSNRTVVYFSRDRPQRTIFSFIYTVAIEIGKLFSINVAPVCRKM